MECQGIKWYMEGHHGHSNRGMGLAGVGFLSRPCRQKPRERENVGMGDMRAAVAITRCAVYLVQVPRLPLAFCAVFIPLAIYQSSIVHEHDLR